MADKFDKDTHVMRSFNLKDTAHQSDGTESPPRISEAVLRAMPSDTVDTIEGTIKSKTPPLKLDNASYDATMKSLFALVYDRLDKGLDEAWRSAWGYGGALDDSAEEKWARQFSEMFVFTAYLGQAQTFGTMGDPPNGKYDMPYVRRIDEGDPDPAYTPFGACQHLANYMVVTRGIPSQKLEPAGLGAGQLHGGTAFRAWVQSNSKGTIVEINQALGKKGPLTPGSMFVFDTPDASRHIGGVLRLSRGGEQYQPMDTGVLAGMDDTGTADHNGKDGISNAKPGLGGVGVLESVVPSLPYLDYLKTARPLGFAHFVVVDTKNQARFISRALPMHHGNKGFAVTRYVWSLRCLPLEGRAFWILSTFNSSNAKACAAELVKSGSRGKPIRDLAELAPTKAKTNGSLLVLLNVLGSTPGAPDAGAHGTGVKVHRRKYKSSDEWSPYRGTSTTYHGTGFPGDLGAVKAEGSQSVYAKWASMKLDEEWTYQDPSAKTNIQVRDITRGVTYFSRNINPASESETRAPLPRELA